MYPHTYTYIHTRTFDKLRLTMTTFCIRVYSVNGMSAIRAQLVVALSVNALLESAKL